MTDGNTALAAKYQRTVLKGFASREDESSVPAYMLSLGVDPDFVQSLIAVLVASSDMIRANKAEPLRKKIRELTAVTVDELDPVLEAIKIADDHDRSFLVVQAFLIGVLIGKGR